MAHFINKKDIKDTFAFLTKIQKKNKFHKIFWIFHFCEKAFYVPP